MSIYIYKERRRVTHGGLLPCGLWVADSILTHSLFFFLLVRRSLLSSSSSSSLHNYLPIFAATTSEIALLSLFSSLSLSFSISPLYTHDQSTHPIFPILVVDIDTHPLALGNAIFLTGSPIFSSLL